jgi:FixJ family two-component response regulator
MPSTSTAVVAIVDDDAAVRTALSGLLSASGIRPRSYALARDFLDSLASETPDCLIVDFHMPGMTGLELQEQLSRSGVSIPTIVMTAHGDAELRKRCLAAGATAYLTKPFDGDALIASINSTTA